jgi:hypothetical protein
MHFKRTVTALGLLTLLVGSLLAARDDKKDDKKTADEPKKLEAKSSPYSPASTVDFAKELALPFPSLATLGARLEAARKSGDAVDLAAAALELRAAEKVADKKAKVTSDDVAKEAAALAKAHRSSAELKAVAILLKDDDAAKEIATAVKAAVKEEDEETKAFKAGEKGKGIRGNLTVKNGTAYTMDVYVNGRNVGWVNPYRDYTYAINDPPGTNTSLVAYPRERPDLKWGPTNFFEEYTNYIWYLNP